MTHSIHDPITPISDAELDAFLAGDHLQPHRILGLHPGPAGSDIRAYHPDATSAEIQIGRGTVRPMQPLRGGLWTISIPRSVKVRTYRIAFRFADGTRWETEDPYRFLPTIGEQDLHYFSEGTHRRLWEKMGSHVRTVDGVQGVSFAVWAPNARRVSVVGAFCGWDGRRYPMRSLGASGVFELFIPGIGAGELYKYEILTAEGMIRLKGDPYAQSMQLSPDTESRVYQSKFAWSDDDWMQRRPARDPIHEPMNIYEVHLGSWARAPDDGNRPLSYREIAPRLVEHVRRLGFSHVQLLPISEHPFTGSWGYQITGYFAPTARYGSPDDFRYFVDTCHHAGIGVILDWVPAHFPKDDYALRRFDGTALYEHADPRRAEHPDWGTLVFNYGRNEVRSFLIANALYWLSEFHIDGLRVDAVASMLYLDYSREPGNWAPNPQGGREDLDAVDFLRTLNATVHEDQPGTFTVAEESTAWPGVTHSVADGGLGFTFKWNMGWMHDTLAYFRTDPLYRAHHHDQLTFGIMYEYSERFIMPLSHDEVVHGKGSLIGKMPGDDWQRLANLRLLLTYQYTRPGKQLVFMGTELGSYREWDHDSSLDWHLAEEPARAGLQRFVEELGHMYLAQPAFWRRDPDPEGFCWIECCDRKNSVISYVRSSGEGHAVVVLNFTPVPHSGYRVGVPAAGRYGVRLSSDDTAFGGSGIERAHETATEPMPWQGFDQSIAIQLPPLGALVLEPA